MLLKGMGDDVSSVRDTAFKACKMFSLGLFSSVLRAARFRVGQADEIPAELKLRCASVYR